MELECLKDKLLKAILTAERLTSKNISLPILQTIFLELQGDQLIIKSTNLEVGLQITLGVKSIKPGKICVEAKTLSQLLNNLPKEDKINLKVDETRLIITSKSNKAILKSFPIDDFPLIPRAEGDKHIFNQNSFISGIKSVVYAGSTSNIKPEISSVYLFYDGSDYIFVSTDSFRLAEKKFTDKVNSDFNPIIIPLKSSLEALKVFEDSSEPLTLQHNNHQLFIFNKEIYFTCQLINGVYPDYRQIIPKQFKTKIVVNKNDLINALKTNNIFTDRFNQINISFNKNGLELNSKNQDSGENTSYLKATLEGEENESILNSRYLIDGLQSIPQENVFIGLNERNKAVLLKAVGDDSFTYLIMPVTR